MNYAPGSSVMPFEGTSRVSRVTSTIVHTIEDSYDSISSSFFDKFFLIIDELGRCSPPSSILVFFQFIISLYQYYITTYLVYLPDTWDLNFFPDKIIRYFNYPVDFSLGNRDIFDSGIPSYFILILSALIILYLLFIIIYYQLNKIFPQYNAHITRFIISFLIPIILPPLCYNIGFSFNLIFADKVEIIDNANTTDINNTDIYFPGNDYDQLLTDSAKNYRPLYITSTVFGIIFYLTLIIIFYVDIKFRSSTPYLENTALSSWDNTPLFMCLYGTTLTILFSRFIVRLPHWTCYFFTVCCILYNFHILYKFFFFPMIKKWVNVAFSIVICSGLFSSFFQLLPISSLYRIIIPFIILAISIPIFMVSFHFLRKKIIQKKIDEINITKENHALRYLRLTISSKCEEFVNFKWLKTINQINTTKLLCQTAQMISFFPSESQNLTFYISLLSKKHDLSLHQRFLFFQLRRVHVLRQSSTSKQLNDDLAFVSRATNQSIASFSQFLMRTVDDRQILSIDRLSYLSRLNRSTSSLCHEAMSRYPNSSRLLFTVSRYVIECQADFKGGVLLYQEGQQIDRGKRASVDYAFRSMANLFPTYLWKRILDCKGKNIMNRRRSKSGSQMSADSISNGRVNQISDTDFESNDKISSSVLDNPRLRFSLRKAVSNMKSTGISILILSSVLRFLLSFIICVSVIAIASNFLNERRINYQNIAQIGKVRKSLDLSLFRMAKLWSLNLSLSPKLADIKSALGPDVTLNDYNNFSVSPNLALFVDVIDCIKAIEELGKLLIEVKYDDSMSISDKSTADFVQMSNISFCNRKTKTVIQSTTSIRYFSLYLLNSAIRASTLPQRYNNPYDWKDDDCICEVILNMNSVVDALNNQSTVLVSQEEDLSKAMQIDIIIFFCICTPVAFAVFIIPFIVGYVKTYFEFQQIFDVLSLLPIKIYKDASKPIAMFPTDFEQNQETVSQMDQKGCQKVALVLSAVISSIVIVGSLIGVCFTILDVNSKFYALVKWLEMGSGRTPMLIETVTNAIYAGIYGYIGDTDYTTLVYHLELVFNYSQKLLYQHKAMIWGSDGSVSCNNFSKRLDSLHFTNTCSINPQGNSFQNSYQCMSLDQQIMTFNKFAKDVYLTLLYAQLHSNSTNGEDENEDDDDDEYDYNIAFLNVLNGYEAINLHYLGITHLLPKLEAAQNILDEGINLKIEQLREYCLIIALFTLAVEFILFIIDMILFNFLNDEYNIVRILIARLPPVSVVKTQSLIELITGKSDIDQSKSLNPIMINVRFNSDSIIVFDKQCKIQLINSATSKTFGFTKEQLFRADLSTVISKDDYLVIQDKINRNIEFKKNTKSSSNSMKNDNNINNDSHIYDDDENGLSRRLSSILNNSDDDFNLNLKNKSGGQLSSEKVDLYHEPFRLVLIGIKDDQSKIIISAVLAYLPEPDDVYALIMKDETQIYINKEDIKTAKLKADSIFSQVLPRAIAQNGRINENISFSIKQVSVVNIKILNFNDSLPHLTSIQAMRNMSELFTLFDAQLMNYPNLTKTSVISDSFQAVGGLFNVNSIRKISSRSEDAKIMHVNSENFKIGNNNANENQNAELNESNNNNEDVNNNVINDSNNNNSNDSNSINNSDNINNNNANYVNNNDSNNNNNINNSTDGNRNAASNNNNNGNPNNVNNNNTDNDNNAANNNNNANNSSDNNNVNTNADDVGVDDAAKPEANNSQANINSNNSNISIISSKSSRISITSSMGGVSHKPSFDSQKVRQVMSRKSIYDIKSLNPDQSVRFSNIILDSIYFAFNCISATEYANNSYGTNYVLGIGISIGGPVTAGTLGKEHIQFEVVGGVLKESFLLNSVAEEGMIVVTEDVYKIVSDSFEAQKNLVFEKYKKINSLHSKKIETYIVKPSDVLCSQVDEAGFSSPYQSGRDNVDGSNSNDNDNENENSRNDIDQELLQMQEDQQILSPEDDL